LARVIAPTAQLPVAQQRAHGHGVTLNLQRWPDSHDLLDDDRRLVIQFGEALDLPVLENEARVERTGDQAIVARIFGFLMASGALFPATRQERSRKTSS
jgi:hypothetical protein